MANYLGIQTSLIVSSTVEIDHRLKADRKVLAICHALGATRYINSIVGRQLYSVAEFAEHGVELKFIQSRVVPYRQFGERFVPSLSIVDAMMFNSKALSPRKAGNSVFNSRWLVPHSLFQ